MSRNLQAVLIIIFFLVAVFAIPLKLVLSKLAMTPQIAEIFQQSGVYPSPSTNPQPSYNPLPSNPPAPSNPSVSNPPQPNSPGPEPPGPNPSASHGPINVCSDITPKSPAVQRGQTITFRCTGTVEDSDHVADFRVKFRAFGGSTFSQIAYQSKVANSGTKSAIFIYNYGVPTTAADGDYLVECRICNPDETDCTNWGASQ